MQKFLPAPDSQSDFKLILMPRLCLHVITIIRLPYKNFSSALTIPMKCALKWLNGVGLVGCSLNRTQTGGTKRFSR